MSRSSGWNRRDFIRFAGLAAGSALVKPVSAESQAYQAQATAVGPYHLVDSVTAPEYALPAGKRSILGCCPVPACNNPGGRRVACCRAFKICNDCSGRRGFSKAPDSRLQSKYFLQVNDSLSSRRFKLLGRPWGTGPRLPTDFIEQGVRGALAATQ